MEGQKISSIIQQVYGQEVLGKNGKILKFFTKTWNYLTLSNLTPVEYRQAKIGIILSTFSLSIVILLGIFYYNKFTFQLQNVLTSESKIETILDRRRNIAVNLSKIVLDYSVYEKQLFDTVVGSRNLFASKTLSDKLDKLQGSQGGNQGRLQNDLEALKKDLGKSTDASFIPKLFALAEQYPDLKLSQNFLKFTDALVELEKSLADARTEHNNFVNAYITSIKTVPGNFFNFFFRFKPYSYYKASDDARNFWKISY